MPIGVDYNGRALWRVELNQLILSLLLLTTSQAGGNFEGIYVRLKVY